MFDEEEFLQISGIQHFSFCRRQWALIHIENQWCENYHTVQGQIVHEKAHDKFFKESRKNTIIVRGMPVFSKELGISGECDIVEFQKDKNGIAINDLEGLYKIVPVEYKKGSPKDGDCDRLQLCAQALCLEEMLCCDIPEAYIYYAEIKHREKIYIDEILRDKLKAILTEMHSMYRRKYTPKVKTDKHCNSCSLKDLCLPKVCGNKSVKSYIESFIKGGGDKNEKTP